MKPLEAGSEGRGDPEQNLQPSPLTTEASDTLFPFNEARTRRLHLLHFHDRPESHTPGFVTRPVRGAVLMLLMLLMMFTARPSSYKMNRVFTGSPTPTDSTANEIYAHVF